MCVDKIHRRVPAFGKVLAVGALLAACSCSGVEWSETEEPEPTISIQNPTSAATYSTVWTDLRLGGTVTHANFVHARNASTGQTVEGFVIYLEGADTWFADLQGLRPGDNQITVTASAAAVGSGTATARITIARPLVPVNLIFNGADQNSASTFWTDIHSFGQTHKIALFQDGTGRSTTGAAHSENAGAVAGFTWSMLGPDSIQILNCMTCSFQKLSRVSGSLGTEAFFGQIDTIGGIQQINVHSFSLASGNL